MVDTTAPPKMADAAEHMRAAVRAIIQKHHPDMQKPDLDAMTQRIADAEFKFVSDVASSNNFFQVVDKLRTEEAGCCGGECGCGER